MTPTTKWLKSDSASADDAGFDMNFSELNTPVTDACPSDYERSITDISSSETHRGIRSDLGTLIHGGKLGPTNKKLPGAFWLPLKKRQELREICSPVRGSRVMSAALPNHRNNKDPSYNISKPASATTDQSAKIPKPATIATDQSSKVPKPMGLVMGKFDAGTSEATAELTKKIPSKMIWNRTSLAP